MPVVQRRPAADARDYLVDGVADDDDKYENDDEDTRPPRSSALQGGWANAMKASSDGKRYSKEFRFEEDFQLVKFLDSEPFACFSQHWITRSGKCSFVCLEDVAPNQCPLCKKGDDPRPKAAFSVVNLSAEEPVVEMLITSPTLTRQLAALANDPKTGPLDRACYALSRTGKGLKAVYNIQVVRPLYLKEDWGISAEEVERIVDGFEPLTSDAIALTSKEELEQIAREVVR